MVNLIRYRPWRDLMNFDLLASPFASQEMALDILEKDNALVVKAALPGIRAEDIELETQQNWMTLRAQQQEERQQRGSTWRLRERRYGAWQRTIRLPEGLRVEKAEAVLKDGILTVQIPKINPAQSLLQRIKVNLPKLRLPGFSKSGPEKIEISRN